MVKMKVSGISIDRKTEKVYLELVYQVPSTIVPDWTPEQWPMKTKYITISIDKCRSDNGPVDLEYIRKHMQVYVYVDTPDLPQEIQKYLRYGLTVISRKDTIKILKKHGINETMANKIFNYLSGNMKNPVYGQELDEYIK